MESAWWQRSLQSSGLTNEDIGVYSVKATETPTERKQCEVYLEPYVNDTLPEYVDGEARARLMRRYRSLPERFYTSTRLPVVTPDTFEAWFESARQEEYYWD